MRRPTILTIVIHAGCWLLFLSLPLVFISGSDYSRIAERVTSSEYWSFCFTYIVLFYLVANVLIPYFFFKKKYFTFLISLLVLFSAVMFLSPFKRLMDPGRAANPIFELPPPPGPYGRPPIFDRPPDSNFRLGLRNDRPPNSNFWPGLLRNGQPPFINHIDIVSLFMFLVVVALGMTIRISRQWRTMEQRAIQAESGKAHAELSFLKAQINPHFLFNTLNNLYVLALTRSDNTAESIMRLSNIMRYVTDEAGRAWVTVGEEVNCIRDYINLQRLRVSKQTEINFAVEPGMEDGHIAPLIFMTFIENAFKYGVSTHHPSTIDISLTRRDDQMKFNCNNPVFPGSESRERAGVGIANAKQRLDYLYGDKYLLQIDSNDIQFNVRLVIPFFQKVPDAAKMYRD